MYKFSWDSNILTTTVLSLSILLSGTVLAEEGQASDGVGEAGDQGSDGGDEAEEGGDEADVGEGAAVEKSEGPPEAEAAVEVEPTPAFEEAASEAEESSPAPREAPAVPVAPVAAPMVVFIPSFQERARFNYTTDKLFDGDLGAGWTIGNRARMGLWAGVGNRIGGFIQLQDVRNWGSEVNPVTGGEGSLADFVADGLDIHQAYGELSTSFGLNVRIGRQEIAWQGQRLIGTGNWSDSGRSFDAVRLRYSRPDVVGLELLYSKLSERPTSDADGSDRKDDMHLVGIGGGPRLGDVLMLDGMALVRIDPANSETMATLGAYAKGQVGVFRYTVEGYGQVGKRGDDSIGAFLVGLRVGADLPVAAELYAGGGVDLVSGDSEPGDGRIGRFDTLYASNHHFYGHMDLYTTLPDDTLGQGLVDGQVNFRLQPLQSLALRVDAHVFAAAAPLDTEAALHGVELDIEAAFSPVEQLSVGVGVWTYFPAAFWGENAKAELGAYLVTDFRFE